MLKPLCTSLAISATLACASQTRIAEPLRAAIAAEQAGRVVELRVSCYYGDLYDENEKWLLSPHPFADTHHIVDLDGAPIHPTGQRGVVPAGTKFTIRRLEFPDLHAVSMRMLTTPRYNPWVYLTPEEGSGLPSTRNAFVLLLPMDMETRSQVEAALDDLLAPEGEVAEWLAERSPSIQVAIKHKEMAVGMSQEELLMAVGKPHRWFNDTHEMQSARVAWYPAQEAWMVNGKVVAVKEPRDKPEPPTREPAAAPPTSGEKPAEPAQPDSADAAETPAAES